MINLLNLFHGFILDSSFILGKHLNISMFTNANSTYLLRFLLIIYS